jgi:hypothetical protein
MDAIKETDGRTPTKPLCFVIGPIGKVGSAERKHADLLLNAVIRHVLEADNFGFAVKRADEDADPGMIGDRVIADIIHAKLVVADLTDLNPNVFYELGIRHSTEKPVIHLARSGTLLPFDNVTHRTIFVDLTDWQSTEEARGRLAASARAVQSPTYTVSNPITQANASFKMRQSADPIDRALALMQDRITSLEHRSTNLAGTRNDDVIAAVLDALATNAANMLRNGMPARDIRLHTLSEASAVGIALTVCDVDPEIGIELRAENKSMFIDIDQIKG